jgi:hypothetical protein
MNSVNNQDFRFSQNTNHPVAQQQAQIPSTAGSLGLHPLPNGTPMQILGPPKQTVAPQPQPQRQVQQQRVITFFI